MSNCCNLHVHSDFSCKDGAQRVSEIIDTVRTFKQEACAITDHGTMAGALAFWKAAKDGGIKPIIGCELYIDEEFSKAKRPNHLTVLAKNQSGYQALKGLLTIANLQNYRYTGRVKRHWLFKHCKDLIVMSGCLASELRHLSPEDADKYVSTMKDVFRGNFYLEVMNAQNAQQQALNERCAELGEKYGVKLVGTSDSHYSTCAHRQRYKLINTFDYEDGDIDLSLQESLQHPAASLEIADKVEVYEIERPPSMPSLPGRKRKLKTILKPRRTKANAERLDYEISVIEKMGFEDYFLILADLISSNPGIKFGPGRGSAAGSLVSYLLGITTVDPIKHGLIFERFLNPGRKSLPDIDIDVQTSKRQDALEYLHHKYGNVFSLSNYNKIKAKTALKDALRGDGVDFDEANRVTKLLPRPRAGFDASLEEALELSPEFKQWADLNPTTYAKALDMEGLIRGEGKHASAICIVPLNDLPEKYTALKKDKDSDIPVSEFDMRDAEAVGLVKFDILGLRTLDVIAKCDQTDNYEIQEVYDFLAEEDLYGVFQAESGEMQRIFRECRPQSIDDIAALIALYRPGPIESGMLNIYTDNTARPWGVLEIDSVLVETRGVLLYQEQVMEIARRLAGYSLPDADELRKILGKKLIDKVAAEKVKFLKGCAANGKDGSGIWDVIEQFAKYSFNKSHSVSYAYLTYATAYAKMMNPAKFYAAQIDSFDSFDSRARAIASAISQGVDIVRPTLLSYRKCNQSGGCVQLGLESIKGLPRSTIDVIQEHRPTKIMALREKLGKKAVDAKAVKALIMGCVLNTTMSRNEMIAKLTGSKDPVEPDPLFAHDVHAFGVVLDKAALSEMAGVRNATSGGPLDSESETTCGVLVSFQIKNTRRGEKFGILMFQDDRSCEELIAWPGVYALVKETLTLASPFLIRRKGESIVSLVRLSEQV